MLNQEDFIESILIKAMPDIEDSTLDLMIEDVIPVLEDRILTNIATKLTDIQLQKFTALLKEKKADKELSDFLSKNVADYEDYMTKLYTDFETMYLKEFKNYNKI